MRNYEIVSTVRPKYNSHPRDPKIVDVVDRWSLAKVIKILEKYKMIISDSKNYLVIQNFSENYQLNHIAPELRLSPRSVNNQGYLSNVNYPLSAPLNLQHLTVIRSTPGSNIQVSLMVSKERQNCSGQYVEVS
jgi:hypothetical protein